jgi:cytochrome c oxidase cbb3-type subunit 3
MAIVGMLLLAGCDRERREFRVPPAAAARVNTISVSTLHPGGTGPAPATSNSYEENAWAVNEGGRLYNWYNCVGCHEHGGGGIGPPLMDSLWIYGSDPANVFATIVEGRPNGMPSFRGKIPDYQVWQLVAYVRSMSGLLRMDVAPSRDDHMQMGAPPQAAPPQPPKQSTGSVQH